MALDALSQLFRSFPPMSNKPREQTEAWLKKSYINTLFSPIYSTLSTFLDATHKSMAERRRRSIKRCFVKLSFYRLKEEEFVRAQLLPIAGTYSQRQKLPGFIITIYDHDSIKHCARAVRSWNCGCMENFSIHPLSDKRESNATHSDFCTF